MFVDQYAYSKANPHLLSRLVFELILTRFATLIDRFDGIRRVEECIMPDTMKDHIHVAPEARLVVENGHIPLYTRAEFHTDVSYPCTCATDNNC